MEKNQNLVELWGIAAASPEFSHENHGESFYKFPLQVDRLSGQSDRPMILASQKLLSSIDISSGIPLQIHGQLRSFNNKNKEGSRLIISVFAQVLEIGDGSFFNQIFLSGTLCKPPVLRRTPLGRNICDLILAVNRHYGRADYLPCIAWGQVATHLSSYEVGDRISLEGRVQSRTYLKQVENKTQERTAFEVSIMRLLSSEDNSTE